jgi:hypothetical protein
LLGLIEASDHGPVAPVCIKMWALQDSNL